ncbi:hypothetical protein RRG08_017171 [Elysia crispata]|uniref:Uncharacterized protein n=1 Tax=Elysia crispata TaxID=231223 RepID=A0AAE1E8K1_9GAST|nr:hypothetical protein RRG08_017171 [Elysia crispata]
MHGNLRMPDNSRRFDVTKDTVLIKPKEDFHCPQQGAHNSGTVERVHLEIAKLVSTRGQPSSMSGDFETQTILLTVKGNTTKQCGLAHHGPQDSYGLHLIHGDCGLTKLRMSGYIRTRVDP